MTKARRVDYDGANLKPAYPTVAGKVGEALLTRGHAVVEGEALLDLPGTGIQVWIARTDVESPRGRYARWRSPHCDRVNGPHCTLAEPPSFLGCSLYLVYVHRDRGIDVRCTITLGLFEGMAGIGGFLPDVFFCSKHARACGGVGEQSKWICSRLRDVVPWDRERSSVCAGSGLNVRPPSLAHYREGKHDG